MMLLKYKIYIIILLEILRVKAAEEYLMQLSPQVLQQNFHRCLEIAKEPNFDPDSVTGKPWRIYYSWNLKLDNVCVDAHFQPATPEIIRRIKFDMQNMLSEQPPWDFASLLMTVGRNRKEMLLIPDKSQIPGKYFGVDNHDNEYITRKTNLVRLQMKLVSLGKFLFFMDCQIGIAWLGARFDQVPYRIDVEAAVSSLMPFLGLGNHACSKEKNLIEHVVKPEERERPSPHFMQSAPQ